MSDGQPAVDGPWSHNVLEPWLEEFHVSLVAASQFVLSGNIHDRVLMPGSDALAKYVRLTDALTAIAFKQGFEYVLVWDRIVGLRIATPPGGDPGVVDEVRGELRLNRLQPEPSDVALAIPDLQRLLGPVVGYGRRGVLIIDYASRLDLHNAGQTSGGGSVPAEIGELFAVAEKLSREAVPRSGSTYNPILWLVDSERDLPRWFVGHNDGVRVITVPKPDRRLRTYAAYHYYLHQLQGSDDESARRAAAHTFADQTHDLTLRAMEDIWRLARGRHLRVEEIEKAARAYRVGVVRNPWSDPELHEKIAGAEQSITDKRTPFDAKVFGQSEAVHKTVDILMRSSLGLSSAHAQGDATRPRGVLFFAGPTGVGKTQLAKAINRIVFDSDSPLRFDMSEFSQEQAEARLIGAPPGYVGHGAGGELTNGIRQKPFSVVLFDEIEKAHPAIFDKFLQILDDGRLTDGSGQTAYFSETIIVFTSNWGMYEFVPAESGNREPRRQLITRPESYGELARVVTANIVKGFTETLERPELLNRIGLDNIVVFNFISEDDARDIFDSNVENVVRRLKESGKELVIDSEAIEPIWEFAWNRCDGEGMGGRGIGTAVESALTNSLARAIYTGSLTGASRIHACRAAKDAAGRWTMEVREG